MHGHIERKLRIIDMDIRITMLGIELWFLLPRIHASFVEYLKRDTSRMQSLSVEEQQLYPSGMYLELLEGIKDEKDKDTCFWRQIKVF